MNELDEERDFLLRSLEDLEREHDAGDVDDHDYDALKDDYTVRAAAVLRAIEQGGPRRRSVGRRSRGRALVVAAGVLVFAVLAGALVARSAGRREAGDTVTGDIRQSITQKLNDAGQRGSEGRYEDAVALYDEVLADQPDNAEAMTYRGWNLTLAGEPSEGLTQLIEAATVHGDYPDVHALLAIVFFRNGLVEEASRELDTLDTLDPPAVVRDLVSGLRDEIDAASSG